MDVVTAILALFAVPEMIALGVKGGSVSAVSLKEAKYGFHDSMQGVFDVFRHRWLTLRTSIIGAIIGMIPGLGGDAASWICYGHAVQTSKHPERFGKGTVEGVIAPETANNAKEGGSLLPTLFFGVPDKLGHGDSAGSIPRPRHSAGADSDARTARSGLDTYMGPSRREHQLLLEKCRELLSKYAFTFRVTGIATRSHGSAIDPKGLDCRKNHTACGSRPIHRRAPRWERSARHRSCQDRLAEGNARRDSEQKDRWLSPTES